MGEQEPLWHDTFEDALRTAAEAANPKKVAHELWPEKPIADAVKLLWHCLDPDRQEKLSASQVALVITRGRQAGCHAPMAFLGAAAGYHSEPIEPEDEKAKLEREFIQAQEQLSILAKRFERLNKR